MSSSDEGQLNVRSPRKLRISKICCSGDIDAKAAPIICETLKRATFEDLRRAAPLRKPKPETEFKCDAARSEHLLVPKMDDRRKNRAHLYAKKNRELIRESSGSTSRSKSKQATKKR